VFDLEGSLEHRSDYGHDARDTGDCMFDHGLLSVPIALCGTVVVVVVVAANLALFFALFFCWLSPEFEASLSGCVVPWRLSESERFGGVVFLITSSVSGVVQITLFIFASHGVSEIAMVTFLHLPQ
jgi:hypothetical protein